MDQIDKLEQEARRRGYSTTEYLLYLILNELRASDEVKLSTELPKGGGRKTKRNLWKKKTA